MSAFPISRISYSFNKEFQNIVHYLFAVKLELRTENRRTPNDWLSRDDKNVDKFCADPKCNFTFTIAGYKDLLP